MKTVRCREKGRQRRVGSGHSGTAPSAFTAPFLVIQHGARFLLRNINMRFDNCSSLIDISIGPRPVANGSVSKAVSCLRLKATMQVGMLRFRNIDQP
jgi:hypothetical protein